MMKKYIIIFVVAVLSFVACSEDNVDNGGGRNLGERVVPAEAGYFSVLVRTADTWSVRSDAEWLTFDNVRGKGDGVFTVYFDSNSSSLSQIRLNRAGRIFVEHYGAADTLYVKQCGQAVSLAFADDATAVAAAGGEISVPVSCNISGDDTSRMKFTSSQKWIGSLRFDAVASEAVFSVGANTSAADRYADITVSYVDGWGERHISTLSLTQKGE
ncbi:MAG: BACON domain-containing protein [Alistipes sp.]|nr:BACON domain-containing protein [Alistipes sp.]